MEVKLRGTVKPYNLYVYKWSVERHTTGILADLSVDLSLKLKIMVTK